MNKLAKKNLILYMTGFSISSFGSGLQFISITWLLYELTGDATYTGLLVGIGFLPSLLLNLFFGVVVDRMNRKKLAIASNITISVGVLIFLLMVFSDTLYVWQIIGLHMIFQLSGSLYRPSIQAFLAEIFEHKDLPKVYSQSGAIGEGGSLLGASLGGIVVAVTSPYVGITINGLAFIISAVCLMKIKTEDRIIKNVVEIKKVSIIYDFVSGLGYLNKNTFLYQLFLIMFVGQLVLHTSVGMLSVYTASYLIADSSLYGFLQSTVSLGSIIAGIITLALIKIFKYHITMISLCIIGISLLIIAFVPILAVIFLGMLLLGVGTTLVRVIMQSVQQIYTESHFHGRMASFRMVINQGSVVIGAPILGLIAEKYGANMSYGFLFIPVCCAIVFSIFLARRRTFRTVVDTMITK